MNAMNELIAAMGAAAPAAPFRIRQGTIISVQADSTTTVTIAGSDTQITGVKVASSCCPIPGATVWLATDGRDWFVLTALAPSGPAWAAMRQSAAQSIPNNTWTDLSWTSRAETAEYGATVSNSGLVCVVPGLYQVTGTVDFVSNATGQRHSALALNGNIAIQGTGHNTAAGSQPTRLRADGLLRLTPGDVVNLSANQNSGAALNTITGAGFNMIRMVWIGPTP